MTPTARAGSPAPGRGSPVTAPDRLPGSPPGLPRLLPPAPDLATHLQRLGPIPPPHPSLIGAIADAGLVGRGGARYPTARKLASVASGRGSGASGRGGGVLRRRPVAVANGTEGEPLSAKDKLLLTHAPHLVLDGLELAAGLVGASDRVLAVERGNPGVELAVRTALAERDDDPTILVRTPRRYVSGQESALVSLISGGPGRPTLTRPSERGVGGRPTLVDNVETLAHLALIARFGPAWYRACGTDEDPGTSLVTVTGAVAAPGVREVAHGHPLGDLLDAAGARDARAVLLGGYFGRWLPVATARRLRLDGASLTAAGASFGCGVIVVVDERSCALDEVARVAGWYAASSAGQCGSCVHGLRDLAGAAAAMDAGNDRRAEAALRRWTAMVRGRGACRLPDGAAGFLESAADVFADEIAQHQRGGCDRAVGQLLPTPAPEAWT